MNKRSNIQRLNAMAANKGRMLQPGFQATGPSADPIKLLVWGASPYVITGFGIVMRAVLKGLFRKYPGQYIIHQLGINHHGNAYDEVEITGGMSNGRYLQWTAGVPMGGGNMNFFGQPRFIETLIRDNRETYDAVFLFEDPFWVGGGIPGAPQNVIFVDAIKNELNRKGQGHTPLVGYFPIDGVPKPSWIQNISKLDVPVTYLNFGANACVRIVPQLANKIQVINHGVDHKVFFPVSEMELRSFKRAFFGDRFVDKFMLLNCNRNQLRKLVPSNLIAFRQFKNIVPESFIFLNMKMMDVGWNLAEVCASLGLQIGKDVLFPPNFRVEKGLTEEELNLLFNASDVVTSTAVGGGWELAVSQAFATKTSVLMPANTSHVELCGDQTKETERRGILYNCANRLSLQICFPGDNEVIRPLPDLEDMVSKLVWMYQNPEACRKMEENAYRWTKNCLVWEDHIVPRFHEIFSKCKEAKKAREQQMRQQAVQAAAA